MSDINALLDQAQAELRAGRKAEAWKLAAPIVKADPNNARAWRVLADISEKDAPDRAAGYRAKAEAAEANARLGPAPATGPTQFFQQPPAQQYAPPNPPAQPQPQQLRPQQGAPVSYQQPPQHPAQPYPPTQYQQTPQYYAPAATAPRKRSIIGTIVRLIIALLILAGAAVLISAGLNNTKRSQSPQSSSSQPLTVIAPDEVTVPARWDAPAYHNAAGRPQQQHDNLPSNDNGIAVPRTSDVEAATPQVRSRASSRRMAALLDSRLG